MAVQKLFSVNEIGKSLSIIMSIRTVCSMDAAAEPPGMGLRRVLMDIIIDRRHGIDLRLKYESFIDVGWHCDVTFTSRTRSKYNSRDDRVSPASGVVDDL